MSERGARRLAWGAFVLYVLMLVATLALAVGVKGGRAGADVSAAGLIFFLSTAAFPAVAILILTRQPRNRIGWILMGIGLAWVFPLHVYGDLALSRGLPGGAAALALGDALWAAPVVLMGTVLLLRFPDGRLPSPGWRKVEWMALVAVPVVTTAIAVEPRHLADLGYPGVQNPLHVEALRPMLDVVLGVILLIPVTILASAVGLVLRYRRSRGTERLQLKWLATSAVAVALVYLAAMIASIDVAWDGPDIPTWVAAIQSAAVFSFALIPIAIGIAILRYRLYDIDLVINKALVYGAMGAFVTALYVAIVVGVGTAIGSERSPALSILATAVAAAAFQPVRERVQRAANRVVYGQRATPYEVLSEFSGRMAQAYATEEVLPRMARIVAEGTGAARVEVWLQVGSDLVRAAGWPAGEGDPSRPPAVPQAGVAVSGTAAVAPVLHQGEALGAVTLHKGRGEGVTPQDTRLLADVASQAGLVLRNVRLIEELRTSRQRLVSAQDAERRRLERDLHDGAQQRLVAIALAVRLARGQVDPARDPQLAQRLDLAADELARALAELRELARGIHPAILTDRGLGPALQSLADRSPVPAVVDAPLDGRLPAPVEATAYFVVSEALANAGKHARATAVAIRATAEHGVLTVEVRDDGMGGADAGRGSGLRGLADRVAAVDGALEVDSPPGRGTALTVRIPVPATDAVPATASTQAAGR